jgi:hypothetical protein
MGSFTALKTSKYALGFGIVLIAGVVLLPVNFVFAGENIPWLKSF